MKKIGAYNVLSLLPYSENSELTNKNQKINDLYFIKSVIDLAVIAVESFIAGHLKSFDAQVGENLCQIRACKIIHLKNKYLISSESQGQLLKEARILKEYKNKLEDVIVLWEEAISQTFVYSKNLDHLEYVHDFLDRHQLFLGLSQEVVFIVSCFFLAHFCVRKKNIPIAINLNFISRELHISKYRAKRLMHKHQLLVCDVGCDFIIEMANDLFPDCAYPTILSKLQGTSDEERSVLPCYMVSEVIFYHSIKCKTPVLFIVHRINALSEIRDVIYFVLVGQEHEMQFSLAQAEHYLSHHCLVVSGRVHDGDEDPESYVHHVLAETPLKLILANTASHPQYAGVRLEPFQLNPLLMLTSECNIKDTYVLEKNLVDMQIFASTHGCSKENPTLFFLEHIYASKLLDEVTQLETTDKARVYNASTLIGLS
ncbi:MAG: hypothetical protein NTW08_01185 [Gammaproteobacteria bacterium]|nr:hypothetical protein [Gammaproteobacteria bacterium]